jgi:hypothetical protein
MALHYNNLDGTSAKETGPQAVNLQGPMPFAKNVAPVSSSEYMRTSLPYKECMETSVCKKLTPPASSSQPIHIFAPSEQLLERWIG